MKKAFFYISVSLFLLIHVKSFATHIVGGEIYYDCLGGDNYKVSLKLYRDCSSSVAYDPIASVMVFDASGTHIQTVEMPFPGAALVPDSVNNPCIISPTNVCVEEALYQSTVNLPGKIGGYYLVYQRCCRNGTIQNLVNPGAVGSTYMEHIPGPEVADCNSSPHFNKRPKKYICNGFDVDFDHSATDPDGDVLVYSFTSPFTGLDACCPKLGTDAAPNAASSLCLSPPSSCPQVGSPPPYSTVPFSSPYSGTFPLSSNPALTINPTTGHISGTPNINGQWVIGICVKEYRAGVLIGTHIRDFQYNVTSCTPLVVSTIAQQTVFCFGFSVDFQNQSVNNTSSPTTYSWNFGDPTTLADSSHLMNPSYAYPDSGKYTVSLIVNKGQPCTDTAQQTFSVYPLLDPDFTYVSTNSCVGNNMFNFTAGGYFASYSTFSWNFSSGANPQTSTLEQPPAVTFNAAGNFPVIFTVKESTCAETYIDTVSIYNYPQASFAADSLIGCKPFTVQFSDSSLHGTPLTYVWDFGDGTTSTLSNPVHTYQDSGLYSVGLTITAPTGCVGTSTFSVPGMISVKPTPSASIYASPMITDVFNSTIDFADSSKGSVSMIFTTGDGAMFDYVPEHYYYDNFGDYSVSQIVTGGNGCPDTATVIIKILPEYLLWLPNAFTPFNKDGVNDVFKPITMGVEMYVMYVYDRWGNEVFKTSDLETGWNGTYQGKPCEGGIYVYKLGYTDMVDLLYHERAGRVTLIR